MNSNPPEDTSEPAPQDFVVHRGTVGVGVRTCRRCDASAYADVPIEAFPHRADCPALAASQRSGRRCVSCGNSVVHHPECGIRIARELRHGPLGHRVLLVDTVNASADLDEIDEIVDGGPLPVEPEVPRWAQTLIDRAGSQLEEAPRDEFDWVRPFVRDAEIRQAQEDYPELRDGRVPGVFLVNPSGHFSSLFEWRRNEMITFDWVDDPLHVTPHIAVQVIPGDPELVRDALAAENGMGC